MDRMAVKAKLKDVVATVAMNEEIRCMARVKEVVITMLLQMSSPAARCTSHGIARRPS
jgi:hypothetical protein